MKHTSKGDGDAQGLSSRAYKVNGIQVNLASTSDADTSFLYPKTSFSLGSWKCLRNSPSLQHLGFDSTELRRVGC